jgi:hypothetical protein
MMPRVTDECQQPHNDETLVDIFFGGSWSKRRQIISHFPSQQSASTTKLLASLSSLCIHTCNWLVVSNLYLVILTSPTFVSPGSLYTSLKVTFLIQSRYSDIRSLLLSVYHELSLQKRCKVTAVCVALYYQMKYPDVTMLDWRCNTSKGHPKGDHSWTCLAWCYIALNLGIVNCVAKLR